MSDVRALLAAERQSRRITHPHLTYTKTGALICNICHLNVKTENLWEGHLRSANHRKNAAASQIAKETHAQTNATNLKKRKIEAVEDAERERESSNDDLDVQRDDGPGGRKKNKSRSESLVEIHLEPPMNNQSQPIPSISISPPPSNTEPSEVPPTATPQEIDEDEWAAFTSEIAPLTTTLPQSTSTNYSATISAAPVSASQLAAQQKAEEETASRTKRKEEEAEEEREDEGRRLEEEMEVMEEMEEKVRRLRELREAIRLRSSGDVGKTEGNNNNTELQEEADLERLKHDERNNQDEDEGEDEDDEDEDVDDWYS